MRCKGEEGSICAQMRGEGGEGSNLRKDEVGRRRGGQSAHRWGRLSATICIYILLHLEIRKDTIPIFFDMIICENNAKGGFREVSVLLSRFYLSK